jgi:cytochrome c2
MLIKIGGGSPKTSQTAGIHWHMNIAVKVEYIAADKRRQNIPWIRVTDKTTGRVTVYQDRENPLNEKQVAAAQPRTMDCMDCHNRPSHDFQSPDHAIDLALLTGRIDTSLPEIKKTAVQAMVKKYRSEPEALRGIAGSITDFYRLNHPKVALQQEKEIKEAILATQAAYERNFFPIMNAEWLDYPNDIGHFIFRGCMRCHDGKHASSTGTVITNDCRACHVILSQGPKMTGHLIIAETGVDFHHPVEIGDAWKQGNCYECHTGVQP